MSKYVGKIVTNQAPAGYSVYFDGTGDYLSVAANAAFQFGTGDFTIEYWYYPTSFGTNTPIDMGYANAGSYVIQNASDGKPYFYSGSTGIVFTATTGYTLNAWNHLAVSRSGTTLSMFINGARVGSATNSTNFNANFALGIGGSPTHSTVYEVIGYMSNVRLVKGTAVYDPTQTSIRVPTQLLRITNTSILTCNSPAIVDQSSNAFAITATGTPTVSTFTPFTAYVPYNPALGASTPGVWTLDEAMQAAATRQWNMYDPSFQNTTLLLHGNGTNGAQNNTFLDSSSNNFTITRNGNTTQGSFTPFSQVPGAWSNFFNGSSYLTTASNAAFQFGTGDFTMECWINMAAGTSLTSYWRSFLSCAGDSASVNGVTLYIADGASGSSVAGEVAAIIGDNTIRIYGGQDIRGLGWVHVALTRSGTTLRLFVNGVQRTSATNSSNITGTSYGAQIGLGILAQNNYFVGYVSNVRVVKGTALYTSSFTPSTIPLTAVANTSLLTCQSNRFVDNSTNNFTITPTGTPSVQPFSPFYPTAAYTPATIGGSGYFDGSGDAITAASNSAFGFTGDFTIEAWVYKGNNGSAGYDILASVGDGNAINGWFIELSTNRTPRFYSPQGLVALGSTANINDNSWHHWAFVRSGSTLTIYLDGVSQASGSVTGTINYTGSALAIGGIGTLTGGWFNGYISNFRIVRGQALTSGNFTPPKSPLTPTSVGWTGANAASSLTGTVSILTNFTNAGIVDSTAKNVLETVGNAQISTTQSKFGGSSMYFDGTGDYLSIPYNAALVFDSGNFTVECWFYLTGNAGLNGNNERKAEFASCIVGIPTTAGWEFGLDGNSTTTGTGISFSNRINSSTAYVITATVTVNQNQWNHVAVVRNGTTTTIYLNGISVGSGTLTNQSITSANSLWIGRQNVNSFNHDFPGYIDDFRITKGVARYTANFTPQTSQWQDQ